MKKIFAALTAGALVSATGAVVAATTEHGGDVVVSGTSADDLIVIDQLGFSYRFTITSNGSTTVETAPIFIDGLPTDVVVNGQEGNDDIVIGVVAGPQMEFHGNLLIDTSVGNDTVSNATSNVEIVGSLTILTGSEDDSVDLSGSVAVTGDVVMRTGTGNDQVSFSGAKGLIDTEAGDGIVVIPNYLGEALTILGGDGPDIITVSGSGVSPDSPQELTIEPKGSKDVVTLDDSSFASVTVRAGFVEGPIPDSKTFDDVRIENSVVHGQATFDGRTEGMDVHFSGTSFDTPPIILGLQAH
ncbi:MAG: hypothetical protein HKN03_05905 [Acidimicrobiales bacterium]|nr:hypothetical protein [Acidimicrobiales bacterium]